MFEHIYEDGYRETIMKVVRYLVKDMDIDVSDSLEIIPDGKNLYEETIQDQSTYTVFEQSMADGRAVEIVTHSAKKHIREVEETLKTYVTENQE